ncbi:MAG: tetratricopeptide repeat protein [Egibacteraceae bacterium]
MEIRVLGPLEIADGDRQVLLGPQQAVVLAALLLEEGRVVPRSRLIDLLWGDETQVSAGTTLRSHVLNLRRLLEPGRKVGEQPKVLLASGVGDVAGYALRVLPEQVDANRFQRLLEEGRAALMVDDPLTAVARLRAGLALWRGPALAGVADRPFALHEVARLEGLRRAALQARIQADLTLGHHAEVVGELEGLVAQHPDDEGLRRYLALALYRSQRPEEAARVCQEGLELLHEYGLDSAALQVLQRDILHQAPELEWAPPGSLHPFQLPPDISEFTGRRSELAALRARLGSTRETPYQAVVISAIDGKPGIGKSALALHAAHELAPQFPDGVLYVNLRGAERQRLAPMQALGQFLRALGIAGEKVPAEAEAASGLYRTLLAGKRMLIVLDNAADADQVRPLLPSSPGCAVIVTSRAPLADLEGGAPLSLRLLDEDEAVALLARLGGRRRVDAEPAEALAVARHCGLLPLALRIAGARLRARPSWPVAALARRLADERRRLGELRVGELGVRASFQLSYGGLDAAEARAFRLLGLLEGSDATAGVAAALTRSTVPEIEAILERLVDAQLLETPSPDRYRFHDLLRLFARERAEAEDDACERAAAVERALRWYLATTEQANAQLRPAVLRASEDDQREDEQREIDPFPNRGAALDWLESERANLVAAAQQAAALAPAAVASVAWRLSDSLLRFFFLQKHWADWQKVGEVGVQAAQRSGNRAGEAGPRNSLGMICFEQRRFDEAIAYYEESLAISREVGDRARESMVLTNLGNVRVEQGRFAEAIGFFEQSLALNRELQDRIGEGYVLNELGIVHHSQERFEHALTYYHRALRIWREVGDPSNEGIALNNLGDTHREQQRFEEARAHYEQALAIFRELGARHAEGQVLWGLGLAVEAVHGTPAARPYWAEALGILTSLGAPQALEVQALLEASYGVTNNSA